MNQIIKSLIVFLAGVGIFASAQAAAEYRPDYVRELMTTDRTTRTITTIMKRMIIIAQGIIGAAVQAIDMTGDMTTTIIDRAARLCIAKPIAQNIARGLFS